MTWHEDDLRADVGAVEPSLAGRALPPHVTSVMRV
jgi:hypothetical protein